MPRRVQTTHQPTPGDSTCKGPPMAGRTSSLDGSDLWAMARLPPEPERVPTNQNTWSRSTSHQTTHSAPLPPSPTGSSNSSKLGGEPTTPWLKWHVYLNTPPPSQRWSDTAATTCATPSSKWHNE